MRQFRILLTPWYKGVLRMVSGNWLSGGGELERFRNRRGMIQQLREATPFGFQPKYLFRDNDQIYGHGVRRFLDSCFIDEVRTAYRCPWKNPFVERFFGTLRREMLDHVIVFGPRHVERLIRDFLDGYYHSHRPHQGLNRQPPVPIERPEFSEAASRLISFPVLNGLHHQYFRVAA